MKSPQTPATPPDPHHRRRHPPLPAPGVGGLAYNMTAPPVTITPPNERPIPTSATPVKPPQTPATPPHPHHRRRHPPLPAPGVGGLACNMTAPPVTITPPNERPIPTSATRREAAPNTRHTTPPAPPTPPSAPCRPQACPSSRT
ncbi:MAG: hypothetical protein HZY76_18680 [Anaerolineae bacterium]|nr:MAG: hypothetical protein HZY76_18680 [Anaerolineae bacterium]